MRETTDLWYLRFPNGRVLRAAGTAVVRQQLASGRIPAGTSFRRSLDEEWRSVERYPEFSDLADTSLRNSAIERREAAGQAPATIASRLDPIQLEQVGVRGLLDELLAALDSTAVARKMVASLVAGGLLGVLGGLSSVPFFSWTLWPPGPGFLLVFGALCVVMWLTGVLARLTFTEVSRLRPARLADGLRGSIGFTARLTLLLAGWLLLLGGLILTARWLPGYLLGPVGEDISLTRQIAGQAVAVLAVFVEALAWPSVLLLLLLGPLVVVEECSAWRALTRWLGLVRRCFGRLLLVEGMALGIGLVVGLPVVLLVWVLTTLNPDPRLALAAYMARSVVTGMAASLVLAYLIVANVFIYLHLRYESAER